jgi:hypothetical protein
MELAEMAELLFSRRGIVAFYACITVYLYGDLAIYAVGKLDNCEKRSHWA